MFESICSLPLPHDLFAQATSPSDPLLAVGLSSGHLHLYKLPNIDEDAAQDSDENVSNTNSSGRRSSLASDNGYGFVGLAWKTRRHKGSCRSLAFTYDGTQIISAGTDGLVKVAGVETGRVEWKIGVPTTKKGDELDEPCLVHALSPQNLLVATDSGALHIYDIRTASQSSPTAPLKPQATHTPHADYISSLTALPPSAESTSGFAKQWVTTGGTTLAVTDLRRGVISQSEDQEEELLSSCFVSGLSKRGTSVGEKVLVGGADGVLTLWEKGQWDDQDERIIVDRQKNGGDSIDCLIPIPDGVATTPSGRGHGGASKTVIAGMGSGLLAMVKLGPNKVVDVLKHDEIEGVVSVDFTTDGRMVSGGGPIVKVWREVDARVLARRAELEEEGEEDEAGAIKGTADSDDSEGESEVDSSDDGKEKRKRKKRKNKSRGIQAAQPKRNKTSLSFSGME